MKKRMVGLVVLAIIASVSLFAGGNQAQASSGVQTLEFPSWQVEQPGFKDWWIEVLPEYEKRYPNAKINMYQVPTTQLQDQLITRLSAGNPPEVVQIPSRIFLQCAAQGWFSPLDNDFAGTDILQNWTGLQKTMVYKGQNLGLLLSGYATQLYYNEKMLDEAGVKVPTNLDELLAAVKAVAALNKDFTGYGLATIQDNAVYSELMFHVVGNGSSILKDGKFNFSDPKFIQAAENYRQLAALSAKGVGPDMKRQLFADGKFALFIDGPFAIPNIDAADPALKPFLKYTRAPYEFVSGSVSNGLHIWSDLKGEKRDLVVNLMKLAAEPHYQVRFSELTSQPGGRSNIVINDPSIRLINELASVAIPIHPDSENLMANYTKFANIMVNGGLRLQQSDSSVSTASIIAEIEANLIREGLVP